MTPDQIQTLATTTADAIAAAGTLRQSRDQARLATTGAVRRIEAALTTILTETGIAAFVGVPNLGTGSLTLRGINVRASRHADKLRRGGYKDPAPLSLVLDARGRLMMATIVRDDELALSLRDATDEDLLPDDLAMVAESAIALLTCHRDQAGVRTEALERNEILAHNLEAALFSWDDGERLPNHSRQLAGL